MRFLQVSGGVILALWLAVAQAYAGSLTLLGAGNAGAAAAPYVGPGDIVSGATAWGSCARVYQVSQASTATSLCDLVAVTGGAAVCTLRGSATGFVDLAASYCAGTTPAAACAAASGGSCKVTKVYDQAGATGGWTQATLSTMPALTFSALNGLPGMTFASASNQFMVSGNITVAQPLTLIGVYKRTSGTTLSAILANGGGANVNLGASSAVDTAFMNAGSAVTAGATDNQFHALIGVFNNASSSLVVDGSATAGAAGATGFTAQGIRIGRHATSGNSMDGLIMEVGAYAIAFNATQYGNMNTNMHNTNGYNF